MDRSLFEGVVLTRHPVLSFERQRARGDRGLPSSIGSNGCRGSSRRSSSGQEGFREKGEVVMAESKSKPFVVVVVVQGSLLQVRTSPNDLSKVGILLDEDIIRPSIWQAEPVVPDPLKGRGQHRWEEVDETDI